GKSFSLISGVDIPVLLALFAFAVQGTSDFWLKSAVVRRGDPFSVITMTSPSFFVTSALLGAILGALQFSAPTLLYGFLTGILSFIAMNLYINSLKEGEASVNTMLFRLSFVITSLLSIGILRESSGWLKWLGLVFAAGAVCSVTLGGGPGGGTSRKAVSLAIAALIFYGVNSFFMKVAALEGVTAPGLAVVASFTFGLLSVLVHFFPWGGFRFLASPAAVRYGLIAGFTQALAINAIVWAMGLGGEASVVIPILQLSFVWTAALAIMSLKEAINARKGLGFVLAVLAIFVLAR
ncbi:MAG: EamA family transporter, partial [Nitrospinota bacterium]